jgi:retinoid hydroxylase
LGDAFSSRILGRRTVFLAGVAGAECFYEDGNIGRADAHPFPLVDLFGGTNMEMFDGPRHVALKSIALTAFGEEAIDAYLPGLQRLVQAALVRLAAGEEFSTSAELRTLAIEAICVNVLGVSDHSQVDVITADYGAVLSGLTAVPLALPGTRYGRARAARDRLLDRLREIVVERREHPGADGLSRMLTAAADDGRRMTDEEAVLEAHHIVIAGYIVYAHMAEVIRRLAEQPDLRERCAAEVRDHAPSEPLTTDVLGELGTCLTVVLEAKRFVPLVPLAFGRAARPFRCAGFMIPQGRIVYLALHLNNHDGRIYADADRFDPDRFGPERAEHRAHDLAFIPQGAGPPTGHQCLGLNYSTVVVLTFLALLVRGYRWDLPAQRLDYDWRRLPPEPRDGLRARLWPR